ncbi:hypothetical protein ACH58_23315 [Achromobacter xylosoxidans]|uniref:hypothetical protein n=1 Tax=Alcaligenes xylosoxydans xylosoxydans TaxID=85698 RepID=UPI00064DE5FE|nr:hypothetical protein [Achromobacter xylosoxidans]KMJ88297.1 hypothetical protein ACH58_23315 [Achromobacter xylosoxidans]
MAGDLIAHHLRLFGIRGECAPRILLEPDQEQLTAVLSSGAEADNVMVVIQPSERACAVLGLRRRVVNQAPRVFEFSVGMPDAARLRTLHPYHAYEAASGVLLHDVQHGPVWVWLECAGWTVLVVGTDLVGDLIRYRQGDPQQAIGDRGGELWGIAGERPVYLYAAQREGEPHDCRHADYWALLLVSALEQHGGMERQPMFPGNAPGAVVITGDDDQAFLDKYAEQQSALYQLPITYLLHPLTKHTRKTLRQMMRANPRVDLGIHPDALETPGAYDERLREQMRWYEGLVGRRPESVRNHGFLNDGYWGHLPAWEREGIVFSSNLPGVCGTTLNGSLLPARMARDGVLTPHWSVLTAFGDGMCSIYGWSQEEARRRVVEYGRSVRDSGLPGVLVFNLHPQNITEMQGLHQAVHDLIAEGFLAWNMRDCLDWALQADGSPSRNRTSKGGLFARLLDKFKF